MLVVLSAIYFLATVDSQMMPPLLASIEHSQPDWANMILWLIPVWGIAATLCSVVAGNPVSRFGASRLLPLALVGLVIGELICATSPGIKTLFAGRVITGASAAGLSLSIMIWINEIFGAERQDQAFGVFAAGAAASPVLGLPAAKLLESHWSWRGPFGGMAVLGIALLVALLFAFRASKSVERSSPQIPIAKRVGYSYFFRSRRTVYVLSLGLIFNIGGFAMFAVFGLWCQQQFGMSVDTVFYYYIWAGLSAVAASLFIGRITKRLGAVRTIRIGTVSIAVAFAIVPLMPGPKYVLPLFMAAGVLTVFRLVPYHTLTMESVEAEMRAPFVGLRNAIAQGGIFVGSAMGALIFGQLGWSYVIVGLLGAVTSIAVLPLLSYIEATPPD